MIGCPGATPDDSAFDNFACVNSGRIITAGTTYTVKFPKPGNYRLVCLIHVNMTGIVHVLNPSEPLPHDQDFYNRQAEIEQRDLLRTATLDWVGNLEKMLPTILAKRKPMRTATWSLLALGNSFLLQAASKACQ